jgi:hypothetical protein
MSDKLDDGVINTAIFVETMFAKVIGLLWRHKMGLTFLVSVLAAAYFLPAAMTGELGMMYGCIGLLSMFVALAIGSNYLMNLLNFREFDHEDHKNPSPDIDQWPHPGR